MFFGRTDAKAETLILWPPHAKSWLIGKHSDAGRDWGQEEKGTTKDEIAGWHHRLDGHEFGWTQGVGSQGGLVCCNSWGCKESDRTEQLNWTELYGTWPPEASVCQEPKWGTLPVAKVMRKEARHMQSRDWASGVPLEILEHPPPKPESAYFTALCSHLHFWLYGGLSPTTSLWKRGNLQLQLIKFLGMTRVFQPINSFGSPLACLNRFFQPHVIVQSLPTVRGMRCSKLSKYRFLWAVKRLIRNCVGEEFFTCWANVCC